MLTECLDCGYIRKNSAGNCPRCESNNHITITYSFLNQIIDNLKLKKVK